MRLGIEEVGVFLQGTDISKSCERLASRRRYFVFPRGVWVWVYV